VFHRLFSCRFCQLVGQLSCQAVLGGGHHFLKQESPRFGFDPIPVSQTQPIVEVAGVIFHGTSILKPSWRGDFLADVCDVSGWVGVHIGSQRCPPRIRTAYTSRCKEATISFAIVKRKAIRSGRTRISVRQLVKRGRNFHLGSFSRLAPDAEFGGDARGALLHAG
jgi:hypothetical protein